MNILRQFLQPIFAVLCIFQLILFSKIDLIMI